MMLCTFIRSLSCGSLALLGLAVSLAGPVQIAEAQDRTRPHVVTRDGPVGDAAGYLQQRTTVRRVPVDPNRPDGPQLIRRQIVEPAAVVSRELSEQPVLPHLAEVRVGGVTVLVDPAVDYRRRTGGIDENHTIRRAQRLHQPAQVGQPARVLRHPLADVAARTPDTPPTPRAIFLRPPLPPQPPAEPPARGDGLLVTGE